MNKLIQILPAAVLCLMSANPVLAADKSTDTDDVVTAVSLVPARVLGVTAGTLVGVPLATIRATAEHTADFQRNISNSLGDADAPAIRFYSAVAALPAGLLTGVIEGPYYGIRNAAKGLDHPFCAESFSAQEEDLTRGQ